MIFLKIGILVLVGAGAWWLTGLDKTAGGESKRGHHLTRSLRCIAVVFLCSMILWIPFSYGGVPILMIAPVSMALVLRSAISELFAHGFVGFIDPNLHDNRQLDPKKAGRYQDIIAHLIQNGRRDEAIKLCEELKQSGEVDIVTLQNTLEFLGVKQGLGPATKPLSEAARLRGLRDFAGAELLLTSLLAKNPADDGAAMMLMRLYAQDLRQPDRAREVLRALELQPHVPASHLEFARRSIDEWSRPQPPPIPKAPFPQPESVDDLIAQGSLGTAVEILEREINAQPGNLELKLKLAEVYAVNCRNVVKAEKIIRQLEQVRNSNPDHVAQARAKLEEWRKAAAVVRAESVKPPA